MIELELQSYRLPDVIAKTTSRAALSSCSCKNRLHVRSIQVVVADKRPPCVPFSRQLRIETESVKGTHHGRTMPDQCCFVEKLETRGQVQEVSRIDVLGKAWHSHGSAIGMIDVKTKLDRVPRQRLRNETDVKRSAIMIVGYGHHWIGARHVHAHMRRRPVSHLSDVVEPQCSGRDATS